MSLPTLTFELSDTVIGAIVGGVIGISGTIAVLIFEYRKWKKGLRVEHLRRHRERMEDLFVRIYNSAGTSFEKSVDQNVQEFSIDTQTDIHFLCPQEVREKIREAMKLDPSKERIDAVRSSLATISIHMTAYLAKIDRHIEDELGITKKGNSQNK